MAYLRNTRLDNSDFRQASLTDARLDGANLTGVRLWETQRGGWSIKGVVCQRALWDRDGKEPTEYAEGEFERLFAEKPRVVLRYQGGMSPVDLLALPLIVERLQAEHPDCILHVRSMKDEDNGVAVMITVENRASHDDGTFKQDIVRLQTKLECIEAERNRLTDHLMPQLLDLIAVSRQTNIIGQITGRVALGGGTMSGDTFNVSGQAGAVGPNTHAHDNTFQQVQAGVGVDLPKLAEELGRLRAAMGQEPGRTREQDKAIGAVADAEEAATKGNGAGALGYLKTVGKWTLGIAEKIGVSVASKAIEKAMTGV